MPSEWLLECVGIGARITPEQPLGCHRNRCSNGVGIRSYQGYNGQFHAFNPELDAKLVKSLSVWWDSKPVVPKFQRR